MIRSVLAVAVSVGLHGFLLSQWPSPFVQVPPWHAEDFLEVIYLLPTREVTVRRSMRQEAAGPAAAPTPPVAAGAPPPAPPTAWVRAASPAARGDDAKAGPAMVPPKRGDGPRAAAGPAALPIPSLVTPADVAHYTYKQQVRRRLQQAIRYPTAGAVRRGTARLRVMIQRDGQVGDAACLAAEAPVFAEATMAGVTAAGPFPPFPPDLAGASIAYEFVVAFQPGAETTVSP